jgi:predicted ABC-type ATPase
MATRTGSPGTSLVIVRGNSASGKTSVAAAVQIGYGRGCALVQQDHLRRIVLREPDVSGATAPGLLDAMVRHALDAGFHVVCEGTMARSRYLDVVADLQADHRGRTSIFYLDVSWAESVRRHDVRTEPYDMSVEEMRGSYRQREVLGLPGEELIEEWVSLTDKVAIVAAALPSPLVFRP